MRTKIILPVFIFACAVLAVSLWTKFFHAESPASPPTPKAAILKTNQPEESAAAPAVPLPATVAVATNLPPALTAHTAGQLQSLAMDSDADSLKAILSELTNADPEIRAAAREAAVQFGDPSAAPSLRSAAAQVASPQEKVALLAAADYLELPPLPVNSVTNPYPSKKYSQAGPPASNPPP